MRPFCAQRWERAEFRRTNHLVGILSCWCSRSTAVCHVQSAWFYQYVSCNWTLFMLYDHLLVCSMYFRHVGPSIDGLQVSSTLFLLLSCTIYICRHSSRTTGKSFRRGEGIREKLQNLSDLQVMRDFRYIHIGRHAYFYTLKTYTWTYVQW